MERAHANHEQDDDDDAEVVTGAAERSTATAEAHDSHHDRQADEKPVKAAGFLRRLTGQAEKTEAPAPELDIEPDAETQAELETLSPDEEQFVEQQIVAAHQAVEAQAPAEFDPEDAGEQAVADFRSKIIDEHVGVEEAFDQTVAELESAESEEAEPQEPYEFDEEPIEIPRADPSGTVEDDPIVPPAPPTAGAGGTGTPPPPPPPPSGPGPAPFSPPPSPIPGPGLAPSASSPNAATYTPNVYYTRTDVAGAALVGGILGYLLGRRRGRIKTEKRLLPVQQKLQARVEDLQQNIIAKETQLRQIAREQVATKKQLHEARSEAPRRAPAPEANQLHGAKVSGERIGKVLLAAEATRNQPKTPEAAAADPAKRIETIGRAELLAMSEKIVVDGTSLRQIYETHLISENGLRRLVTEHLRGGNVQKVLRRELVEHQIDFERDPILRDQQRAKTTAVQAGASDSLAQLLDKNNANESGDSLSYERPKPLTPPSSKSVQQLHRQRQIADISLISVIVVLLALVLYLAFLR